MTSGCVKVTEKMKKIFQKQESREDTHDTHDTPEEILPARLTYLTPALLEEARTQLNETEDTKPKALSELRKMIEAEKNLVSPTDDLFLLAFLRARKFNVKKAFKLLQNYWNFRKEHKKIYDLTDIKTVTSLLHRDFVGFLEYRDKNGCLVLVLKFALWDPDIDSYDEVFRTVTGILIYSLEHEATHIAGFRVILDLRGITWKQLKYFTPSQMLLVVRSTQFSFPARYKGIHVLTENKMLGFLWGLIYPFLTAKLKQRIFFHGEDLTPLLKHIHPSILPEEFGGQAPTFNNTRWADVIDIQGDKILENLNYGYKD